jgi:hypothetical protein
MKKFNFIPKAEKLSEDHMIYDEHKKRFRIIVPVWIYPIFMLVSMFGFFVYLPIFFAMFGAIFISAGLDSRLTVRNNGKIVENTIWSRLPFIIIGAGIEIISLMLIFSKKTGHSSYHYGKKFETFLKIYGIIVLAIFIGRFIYTIIAAVSSVIRKRRCTEAVFAEFVASEAESNKRIYKYEYNGDVYQFRYFTDPSYEIGDIQIYIDPYAPEQFYIGNMFAYGEKIKGYIIILFFIALFTLPLWGIKVITYLSDKNMI